MDIDEEIEDVLDDQPVSILDFMHLWYLMSKRPQRTQLGHSNALLVEKSTSDLFYATGKIIKLIQLDITQLSWFLRQ
jgi:hypothetical protein